MRFCATFEISLDFYGFRAAGVFARVSSVDLCLETLVVKRFLKNGSGFRWQVFAACGQGQDTSDAEGYSSNIRPQTVESLLFVLVETLAVFVRWDSRLFWYVETDIEAWIQAHLVFSAAGVVFYIVCGVWIRCKFSGFMASGSVFVWERSAGLIPGILNLAPVFDYRDFFLTEF